MDTTKTTTTSSIKIPSAANRLAYQLGPTPEQIIKHALRIGLRNIDWNLAHECSPFIDGTDTDHFNITAAMNRLSPARFAELCEGEEHPQKVLADANSKRRHLAWKKSHAENVTPLFGRPMAID
jgi:hypothetical protein